MFKARATQALSSEPVTFHWTDGTESEPELVQSSPPAKPQTSKGLLNVTFKSGDFLTE